MKKYKKPAILFAAAMMGIVAVGCGKSTDTSATGAQTATSDSKQESQKETEEPTTFAPDLEETDVEAVVSGDVLVGKNERYQMPLAGGSWKIDSQSEEKVELSSGSNKMTIQYLTGDAADEIDIFYNAGEFEAYRQETEDIQNYHLVYYKDCAIEGEMDGYVVAVSESGNSVHAKVSGAFGFPNTSDSYVMYTVDAELSDIDDTTIQAVAEAVSQFTALRSMSSVQTPEEAAGADSNTVNLTNKYADAEGRFEIALPEGEWTADESTAGTVSLTNNGQKITISVAEGESASSVLIPQSYEEFATNLIPESESGADEQEILDFHADAAQGTCVYEMHYFDEYVTSAQYIKESRIRKDGVVYTVRAEYTKDADATAVEQGMQAVESFQILK